MPPKKKKLLSRVALMADAPAPTAELTPAVLELRKALEAEVMRFMEIVPELNARYDAALAALPAPDDASAMNIPPGIATVPLELHKVGDPSVKVAAKPLVPPADKDADKDESASRAKEEKEADPVFEMEVTLPANDNVLRALKALKKEASALSGHLTALHQWLGLQVPPVKLSDNSGVDVLDNVVGQLEKAVETVSDEIVGLEVAYLEIRADLETAFFKNPRSGTVLRQMALHDEDAWDDIGKAWRGLQFTCMNTHVTVSRNWKSLKDPRPIHHF